jgi:hypothetical protein
MSLRAFGKKLSDAFNALATTYAVANLEMEKQAAEQGYVLVRGRGATFSLYKVEPEAAQAMLNRVNRRLAEVNKAPNP